MNVLISLRGDVNRALLFDNFNIIKKQFTQLKKLLYFLPTKLLLIMKLFIRSKTIHY